MDCRWRSSDGSELEETYVTWYELTLALLCGACVWLTAGALVGRIAPRRLLAGAAALAAVFLFATVAFFL